MGRAEVILHVSRLTQDKGHFFCGTYTPLLILHRMVISSKAYKVCFLLSTFLSFPGRVLSYGKERATNLQKEVFSTLFRRCLNPEPFERAFRFIFLWRKKNQQKKSKTNLWLEDTKMFTQMEAFLKSEGKTTQAIHSAALKGKQQTWAPSTNPDYYYQLDQKLMGLVLFFELLESDELRKMFDTKARRRVPLQQPKAKHSSLSWSLQSCLSPGTSFAFKKSK